MARPVLVRLLAGIVLTAVLVVSAAAPLVRAASDELTVTRVDFASIGRLAPDVLDLALGASACAVRAGAAALPATLTVIDYSLPSTAKRLLVFDLVAKRLLYEELVAHGSGSGANVPTAFSNTPDSHQTSLGLFVTDRSYVGKNGYSLRMDGLDPGFNDRARERAIVIHGAPYVDLSLAQAQGRIGRSWGCPAVRPAVARQLIDRVAGGGMVFAYYPDSKFLKGSKFVQCAAAAASATTAAAAR